MSNPEHPDHTVVRESLWELESGIVAPEAVDAVLADTVWDRRTEFTAVGPVHLFERPLSFGEFARLGDPTAFSNRRRKVAARREPTGERSALALFGEEMHSADLAVIPEIELRVRGQEKRTRESFPSSELEVLDQIWRPTLEIADTLGIRKGTVQDRITSMMIRTGTRTRIELMLSGLKGGFFDPSWEEIPRVWKKLTDIQREAVQLMHLPMQTTTEKMGVSRVAAWGRMERCFRTTGARTRSELVLSAIANGAFDLNRVELPDPSPRGPTERQREVLAMIDRPNREISSRFGITLNHLEHIFWDLRVRLGASNKLDLVVKAFEHGHLPVEVDPTVAEGLTPNQKDVLANMANSYEGIAGKLGISYSAVKNRIERLMVQTDIHHREGLVAYAIRAGLIELNGARPNASRG